MEYNISSKYINESNIIQINAESIQKLLNYLSQPKIKKNEFLNIQTINIWVEKYMQNVETSELDFFNPKRLNRLTTLFWQKDWGTCRNVSFEVNIFSEDKKLITLESKELK